MPLIPRKLLALELRCGNIVTRPPDTRVYPKMNAPRKSEDHDTFRTQTTLLSKVRRDDEDGWSRFYEFYKGFVHSAAIGAGLSQDEASDVVQETMITVRDHVAGFAPDKTRAKFRTWLGNIVRSRIVDQLRRKKRNPLEKAVNPPADANDSGTSFLHRLPDGNEVELDRLIDGKLEEAILEEARRCTRALVKPGHYQIYDLFSVQELSALEVAETLGIKTVTVRVNAMRVRKVVNRETRRIARQIEHSGSHA